MAHSEASVARSDAVERRAYAALTGAPELIAAADEAMTLADEADRNADGPNLKVRQAVIEADPVTAAALGWLTLPDLTERVRGAGRRRSLLRPAEVDLIDKEGLGAIRTVVRARLTGAPLEDVATRDRGFAANYALAARGSAEDAERIRRLLAKNGLLDEGESDSQ